MQTRDGKGERQSIHRGRQGRDVTGFRNRAFTVSNPFFIVKPRSVRSQSVIASQIKLLGRFRAHRGRVR
jgi:hypothetical protein